MKENKIYFEHTWRWFGPHDPVSLKEIKQTGATGIVTALHQIPVGEVWSIEEINKRKKLIADEGLTWSVVESLPVHENIKKRKSDYKQLIENYKLSIKNLGQCGINIIAYNFMPVLDWSRTNLRVEFGDGAIASKFESKVFAAFDLFILNRSGAEKSYTPELIAEAKETHQNMSAEEREKLTTTVLLGLPGSLEAYTLEEFRSALNEYSKINDEVVRENLFHFLREIIPVAEESGVRMAIHPDDPPWSLLGLPRIVGIKSDIEKILNVTDSPANGLTFCSGSFGAGINNDLKDMAESFSERINFIHLRNLTRNEAGDFTEAYHLEGDVDIYGIMNVLLNEQNNRFRNGRKDYRIPMRPDHGHLMTVEQDKEGIYPGYSLFGRMKGLAELRGMESAIIQTLQ